eukprot:g74.t1
MLIRARRLFGVAARRHGHGGAGGRPFSTPAHGISFTSPWEVLGVPAEASREEIDDAYRSLIFEHHPDHGGTTEDFLRVKQARESLVARLDPDLELDGGSGDGLRRKGFGQRFEEAVQRHDLDKAWTLWASAMSGVQDIDITADITETYLQLLTKSSPRETSPSDASADGARSVPKLRWEGLLVSMDAFQHLRETGLLSGGEEKAAWNGLLWHLAQLPEGWSSMNDILIVCKRMDMLGIQQDLELLRTHIFVGRT